MSSDANPSSVLDLELDVIEEEKAATIHSIPIQKTEALLESPQRKISSSSRFLNAFSNLYLGTSSSSNESEVPQSTSTSTLSAPRSTPTKGVENKLLSMWHNVKYSWSGKIKYNFSTEQPVWLLGRCYHRKYSPLSSTDNSMVFSTTNSIQDDTHSDYALGSTMSAVIPTLYPDISSEIEEIVIPQELGTDAVKNHATDNNWEEGLEGFRRDFYSRIWMTYRHEFPTMKGSNYTSDCGWGCMIRSGQMLLAQGLICHFLGRSWRYDPETQIHSTYEDNVHKKIIKWFGDSSSKSSPFSIHTLVCLGEQMGKKPGDWYGPASVSYLMKKAFENASQENADFDNIAFYVAKDCTVYIEDVEELCRISEEADNISNVPWKISQCQKEQNLDSKDKQSSHWKSLIILIPLRLGAERLNNTYVHCLKLLLSTEHCIGIIGGRPKHSLYFVGFQDDKLIHLDPHYCQEMVDVNQDNFSLQSFHCKSPRKLKTTRIDPSCCVGFFCQTKNDFYNFVESVQLYLHPLRCTSGIINNSNHNSETNNLCSEILFPLFTFSQGRSQDHEKINICEESLYSYSHIKHPKTQGIDGAYGGTAVFDDDVGETEEFVLL